MALSHTIFISCVYRAERGERNQHRPLKWPRDGIQQHGLVLVLSVLYGSGMSGLLGSPSSSINLNLSDFVDTSTQHNTGIRSTPSAAAGSAAQLHDEGQQLTETDSARDDVTEHERDQ